MLLNKSIVLGYILFKNKGQRLRKPCPLCKMNANRKIDLGVQGDKIEYQEQNKKKHDLDYVKNRLIIFHNFFLIKESYQC